MIYPYLIEPTANATPLLSVDYVILDLECDLCITEGNLRGDQLLSSVDDLTIDDARLVDGDPSGLIGDSELADLGGNDFVSEQIDDAPELVAGGDDILLGGLDEFQNAVVHCQRHDYCYRPVELEAIPL